MGLEPSGSERGTRRREVAESAPGARSALFPIVGIGASAGGLEAFTELLKNLPHDTGMAFVLIQHLAPQHESMLTQVLARATPLPVAEVTDRMSVEANHVYVIPPNTDMAISAGVLRLVPRTSRPGPQLPIDHFFASLAEDRKDQAIGVILSGTATDGTLGLKAIKAEGGYTFAQDDTAKYDGMPKSAIAAGFVDYVLSPHDIAKELTRIGRHPYVAPVKSAAEAKPPSLPEDVLGKIYFLLKSTTGVDFSHYKRATVIRRIKRRMVLRNIENLADYLAGLQINPVELDALYRDMLINVTSFFREPEAFETLRREVFPQLVMERPPEAPLRVWVPACSTGEEAYSIAMCAIEFLQEIKSTVGLQIFATDISDAALEKARGGRYTEGEVNAVSAERLQRFFTRTEGGYQVHKPVRDLCVFAKQNVIGDPPFSRLDLISCRNLLIYLDASLQKKLMPIFHYALRAKGFLVLGRSEGVNEFPELFTVVDRKVRIFAKKPKALEDSAYAGLSEWSLHPRAVALPLPDSRDFDLQKEVTRTLLADYTPPGVVVNEDLEIVQFHGHTGPYLDPMAGTASLRLLKLAREGLPLELRTALHQAQTGNTTVRHEGIRIGSGDTLREIGIEVRPLKPDQLNRRYFLVLFRESPPPKHSPATTVGKNAGREGEILALTQQLDQNKSELQDIIEQFALHNEELQTANEEIQSNNEELQSTNEELETAKEELQATNEELTTLNDELRNRNIELSLANNDLNNIIANVNIPILILGGDLRIRRMNPSAAAVFSLIPADVGRPITDLRSALDFPGLDALVKEAIALNAVKEQEAQDHRGRWHSLRVRPYKTSENRIEGAVITLVDISALKAEAIGARSYAEAIVETVRESVLVLDADLRVKAANRAFYETFRSTPGNTLGHLLQELGNGQWNVPQLLTMLREVLPQHTEVREFKLEQEFPEVGRRAVLLNAFQLKQGQNEPPLTLLAITDFTERQRSLEILQEQSKLIDLAHDAIIVRSPTGVVRFWNQGAASLYGWSRDEALGKITHDLLKTRFPAPLDVDGVDRELMEKGEWSGELVHTTREGNLVIVTSRQLLQRGEHGQPDAILEINRDITQHKQAENFVRASEARLRALVSSMDDIVFEVDRQGRCLSAWTSNPQLLPNLKGESPLYNIEDFLPAQSFPPLRDALARVNETNRPESVEYSLNLDGGKRWFLARINRITSLEGNHNTLSVLVRDTTPRKEAEIALQQSEERFRLMVEGVKDYAIFALDTEGRIASWNSGAERIKGYSREEIMGKHFSIFYTPEDIAAGIPDRNLQIAATEGRFEEPEAWRVRKDGSRFYAHVIIAAIRDREGTLLGFAKVTRDITDRKRSEDAVRQLSGHILRLQDEERRRIARDLHDSTAQLLSALGMNLSLAGKRPGVAQDPQASRLIAESESLAKQASEEVRSTSHLLHPPDLDAVGLVAAIRWYAVRFSERSGIAVKLTLPDDLCRLPQDSEIALFRVMQESLTNVQRHSGSKTVRVRISQHDDEVYLEVEDKGRGMPAGVLGPAERQVERLGVGIAGMRERLKQLGGTLEIVSSPKGTKIRAVIPCPPDEPAKVVAANFPT